MASPVSTQTQQLISAIALGDSRLALQAIDQGANVHHEYNGSTPIILASYFDHRDIVHLLLERDAQPTYASHAGLTAEKVAYMMRRSSIINCFHEYTLSKSRQVLEYLLNEHRPAQANQLREALLQLRLPQESQQKKKPSKIFRRKISSGPRPDRSLTVIHKASIDPTLPSDIKTQLNRIQDLYTRHSQLAAEDKSTPFTPVLSGLSTEAYLAIYNRKQPFVINLPKSNDTIDPFAKNSSQFESVIYEQDVEVFFFLLAIECDFHSFNEQGYAPIHYAANQANKNMQIALLFISALMMAGVDPKLQDQTENHKTPLQRIKERTEDQTQAEMLLSSADIGLDLSVMSEDTQQTLLDHLRLLPMKALTLRNSSLITNEILGSLNPVLESLELRNCSGFSSAGILNASCDSIILNRCHELSAAEYYGCFSKQTLAIRIDGTLIYPQKRSGSLLHHAINARNDAVFYALLAFGADVNERDEYGCTPLHRLVSLSNLTRLRRYAAGLLFCGASLENTDNDGQTPLQAAQTNDNVFDILAGFQDRKIVFEFAKNQLANLWPSRADFESRCQLFNIKLKAFNCPEDPRHQLFVAVVSNDVNLAAQALKSGAGLIADQEGNTPLHLAAHLGHYKMARFLIDQGCLPLVSDHMGNTPLDIARSKRYLHLMGFFENQVIKSAFEVIEKHLPQCTPGQQRHVRNIQIALTDASDALDYQNKKVKLSKKLLNELIYQITQIENAISNTEVKNQLMSIKTTLKTHPILSASPTQSVLVVQNRTVQELLALSKYCPDFAIRLATREILYTASTNLTPMHDAISAGDEAVFYYLLAHGGYTFRVDENQTNPLHLAVSRITKNPQQSLLFASALLCLQSDLSDKKDIHGETSLDKAIRKRSEISNEHSGVFDDLIQLLKSSQQPSKIFDWSCLPLELQNKLLNDLYLVDPTALKFRNCAALNNEHLKRFAELSKLNELIILGCENVSDQGLRAIAKKHPQAQIIISDCPRIQSTDYLQLVRSNIRIAIRLATNEILQLNNPTAADLIQVIQARDVDLFFLFLALGSSMENYQDSPLHWAAKAGAKTPEIAEMFITNLIFCGSSVDRLDQCAERPVQKAENHCADTTLFETLKQPWQVLWRASQYSERWPCQSAFNSYWKAFVEKASQQYPYLKPFQLPFHLTETLSLEPIPDNAKESVFNIIAGLCCNLNSVNFSNYGDANASTFTDILNLINHRPSLERVGLNQQQLRQFSQVDIPQNTAELMQQLHGTSLQNNRIGRAKVFLGHADLSNHITSSLIDELRINRTLEHVTLFHNRLDDVILPICRDDARVSEVKLERASIGANLHMLALALRHNQSIYELDISDNNITAADFKELAYVLPATKIAKLNVSGNPIGSEGAIALFNILKDTQIFDLNLANTGLEVDAMEDLARALKNSKVSSLDLSDNTIGNYGLELIAPHLVKISILNLGSTGINYAAAKNLPALVKDVSNLDLRGNSIGLEGAQALADGLKDASRITHLNLAGNQLGDKGAQALATTRCPSLTLLNVSYNQIEQKGRRALEKAQRRHPRATLVIDPEPATSALRV